MKSNGHGVEVKIQNRIMVCTPTHSGSVSHEMANAVQIATVLCLLRGIVLEWCFVSGNSLVQTARNWLTAEFLSRPEFSHLLWWDDDLGVESDGVIKLLESNKDVVAGVYLAKHQKKPFYPYMALGESVDNLQKVERVASGFMLIKRHVIQKIGLECGSYLMENFGLTRMVPHLFAEALVPNPKNPDEMLLLGEDFVLCQRIIEGGFEIFVRTDLQTSHMGRYAYMGRLSDDLANNMQPV
jgi:hypothetical protein